MSKAKQLVENCCPETTQSIREPTSSELSIHELKGNVISELQTLAMTADRLSHAVEKLYDRVITEMEKV